MIELVYLVNPDKCNVTSSNFPTLVKQFNSFKTTTVQWVDGMQHHLHDRYNPEKTVLFWGSHVNFLLASHHHFSVAQLGDHPFAIWLKSSVINLAPSHLLVGSEPRFVEPFSDLNRGGASYISLEGTSPYLGSPSSHNDQPIDLLITMDMRSDYADYLSFLDSANTHLPIEVFKDVIEICTFDTSLYIYDVFKAVLIARSIDFETFSPMTLENTYSHLHLIDMYLRNRKRRDLLEQVDKITENQNLNIVYIATDHQFEFRGNQLTRSQPINYTSYQQLVNQSKVQICSQPSYPNVVDDRIVVSSYLGAGVCGDHNLKSQALGLEIIAPELLTDFLAQPELISSLAHQNKKILDTCCTWISDFEDAVISSFNRWRELR